MMCVERDRAGQHDIEAECLLYYNEVQRGVQEQIRSSQWLLLSTFTQADGTGEPEPSRLDPLSGKVDGILVGEGFAASTRMQRLAARLPVVIIAGTLGTQAADVVAADSFSGAAALITHLIADHGRRRLFSSVGARRTLQTRSSGGSPWTTSSAATRTASSSAPRRESSASPVASRPGKTCSLAPRGNARRRGLRQRPDGHRRSRGLGHGRRRRPRRSGCDRLRRPVSRSPGRSAAQHHPPADAPARPSEPPSRLLDRIAHPALSPAVQLLPTELVLRSRSCGCRRHGHPQAHHDHQARLTSPASAAIRPAPDVMTCLRPLRPSGL